MHFLTQTLILFICCVLIANCQRSLLTWGEESQPLPVFSVNKNLNDILKDAQSKSMVVVFFDDDSVNLEQLTSWNKCKSFSALNHSSFSYINSNGINIKDTFENYDIDNKEQSANIIPYQNKKSIAVKLGVKNIEKCKKISIMNNIYNELLKNGSVIGFYTYNTLSRKKRQESNTIKENASPFYLFEKNEILIYYKNLAVSVNNQNISNIDMTACNVKKINNSYIDVELVGGQNKLTFSISKGTGYWVLINSKWNNEEFIFEPKIEAANDFSYYCPNIISKRFEKSKIKINWSGLQIQPLYEQQTEKKFGDAWHCIGFTTTVIWSGLFIVFLLLGILSVAIIWMMDIKTMDRYDDPKAKTIIINAN